MNVKDQFAKLGYLNPSLAQFHSPKLENYKYDPPIIPADRVHQHKIKISQQFQRGAQSGIRTGPLDSFLTMQLTSTLQASNTQAIEEL